MKKFLLFVLCGVLMCSCGKEQAGIAAPVPYDPEDYGHGMIVLGNKLEDPYTVGNMQAAMESVYPTKAGRKIVEATDLYVRFLPDNDEQYRLLESLGVKMIDHPVDYEIIRDGDYYHDPSLGDRDITWQYAVVDRDFVFPEGVRYELLDECFIPENDFTKDDSEGIDWEEVEREAFRMAGYGDELVLPTKSSSSCPRGRITVEDREFENGKPCGVAGVMVECNVFVKIATCYTDADGYYEMDKSFSLNPHYRLVFKNEKGFALGFNFVIIPGSVSGLGKDSPEGKSVVITEDGDRSLFCRCVVNNAAYEYFSSCSSDSASASPDGGASMVPPENLRIWILRHFNDSSTPMFQQGNWIDGGLLSDYLGDFLWIVKMFLPDVLLGLHDDERYSDIYATTIHELAHASHYVRAGADFWNTFTRSMVVSFITSGCRLYGSGEEENSGYCNVAESWAFYNETLFFRNRYGDGKPAHGTGFWFHPQILLNLDQRGLGRYSIFKALVPETVDNASLRERLLTLYPECKTEINQAFDRYEI